MICEFSGNVAATKCRISKTQTCTVKKSKIKAENRLYNTVQAIALNPLTGAVCFQFILTLFSNTARFDIGQWQNERGLHAASGRKVAKHGTVCFDKNTGVGCYV